MFYNKHYITIGENNCIIKGFSDAFEQPKESDICINEQGGYQFRLFSDGEENPILFDFELMIPLYKYENGEVVKRSDEELNATKSAMMLEPTRANKEQEISTACNKAIVTGMDVETSVGTEHFSLQETDQINLTNAFTAVQQGATEYPYHADGSLCRMFTAEEITNIANAATAHKLYHTTLCNHLLTWVRRAETLEEIQSITYSADNLPEDLATNMQQILTSTNGV